MISQEKNIEFVLCPFNDYHKVPKNRILYHLNRCSAKKYYDYQNIPYYTCKYYQGHIFFSQNELSKHYAECEYKVL